MAVGNNGVKVSGLKNRVLFGGRGGGGGGNGTGVTST